jgi:hypothetical protein
MRQLVVLCAFLLVTPVLRAQQPEPPPAVPQYGWKHNLVSGLTLTQVALKNWEQGGENALAYTALVQGYSVSDEPSTNWRSTYDLGFGQAQLGDRGVRKTDDRLNLESVLLYKIGPDTKLNPYAAATLKTQFATGFTYDSLDRATAVSAFLDPLYLTQSIGESFQPVPEVRTRLGAALREIVTSLYNQYADDPATPEIEKTSIEGGAESVTNVEWPFAENMLLTTELNLFAPFRTFDQIVVRNTTAITAKVSKYVTVLLGVQVINEPKVSPRTQVKESLALGLSYTIL